MKLQKRTHQTQHYEIYNEAHDNMQFDCEFRVISREGFGVDSPENCLVKVISFSKCCEVGHNEHIYQQQQEVFPVPKPYAIVDPGAVVIHVKHATIAGGTVMASFRFEYIAHQAISPSFVFVVAEMEAPEYWYLPWIRSHRLKKRPKQH